jgi:2-polyprenyl-6-methoxyphenol hydroxylase-like FAD-dependent oxidoreductase
LPELNGNHYHVVVIGAGMSGLAASIRLAMYGHRVLLRGAPHRTRRAQQLLPHGWLTSLMSALHALTNWVPEGTKGTPLGKIFRQLRIPREAFDLCEQTRSAIRFPGVQLEFSNDFELFRIRSGCPFPC